MHWLGYDWFGVVFTVYVAVLAKQGGRVMEKDCDSCEHNGLEIDSPCMVDECEECGETFYLDCTHCVAGTCGCCIDEGV